MRNKANTLILTLAGVVLMSSTPSLAKTVATQSPQSPQSPQDNVAVMQSQTTYPTIAGFLGSLIFEKAGLGDKVLKTAQKVAETGNVPNEKFAPKVLGKMGYQPTEPINEKNPLFKKGVSPEIGDFVAILNYSKPMKGKYIDNGYPQEGEYKKSSGFATKDRPNHFGNDFFSSNPTILSVSTGKVVFAGTKPKDPNGKYLGYHVIIETKLNDKTFHITYAHLQNNSSKYKKGDYIIAGTEFAKQGNTGYTKSGNPHSTHLHLGVEVVKGKYEGRQREKYGNTYVDPEGLFKLLEKSQTLGVYAGNGNVIMPNSKNPVSVSEDKIKGTISMATLLNSDVVERNGQNKYAQMGNAQQAITVSMQNQR